MGLQPQFQNQQHHRQHQQQHQHQHQHQQGAPTDAGGPLGQAPARILPVNAGVGDGSAAAADFTFYPRAAGWSSMRPAGGEVLSDMGAFLDNALSSREASAAAGLDPAVAAAGRWLRAAAPGWLYTAVWRGAVRAMLGRSQQQRCRLVTVSGLIREHQLQAVDLLKVDVERAELEVLRGVEGEAGCERLWGSGVHGARRLRRRLFRHALCWRVCAFRHTCTTVAQLSNAAPCLLFRHAPEPHLLCSLPLAAGAAGGT
jgi:hypothetical protein